MGVRKGKSVPMQLYQQHPYAHRLPVHQAQRRVLGAVHVNFQHVHTPMPIRLGHLGQRHRLVHGATGARLVSQRDVG